MAIGLVVRFDFIELTSTHRISRPHEVFWLFALGWAAARATTQPHRLLVSAIAAGTVVGFFGDAHRELIVLSALALIVWLPTVPVPRPTVRVVAPVAGASLYIYLTHFQIYPAVSRAVGPAAAVAGSLAAGVTAWLAAQRLIAAAERILRRRPRRTAAHGRRNGQIASDGGSAPGWRRDGPPDSRFVRSRRAGGIAGRVDLGSRREPRREVVGPVQGGKLAHRNPSALVHSRISVSTVSSVGRGASVSTTYVK